MVFRRVVSAVALPGVLAGALVGCAPAPAATPAAEWSEAPAAAPSRAAPQRRPVAAISYPASGGGRFSAAGAEAGPQRAGGGQLLNYRVEIESDIHGIAIGDFAGFVTDTLNDPRSWTAGGTRLRRVGPGQPEDFTVYLVTPGTRDELCADVPDGYTSCRNGGRVVLNVARWVEGVPGYGAPLTAYRQYMVNHEVGHRLGNGHELCPGAGDPAPVMQQQTLGLHGCTPNPWPYPDRKHRYAGRSGAYNDPIPPREKGRGGSGVR